MCEPNKRGPVELFWLIGVLWWLIFLMLAFARPTG